MHWHTHSTFVRIYISSPPRKKSCMNHPGYTSGPKKIGCYAKIVAWDYRMMLCRPLTFTNFPGVDIKWCTQQQCYWGVIRHLAPPPHPCGHWFHQHLLFCYCAPEPDTSSTVWDLRWGVCKGLYYLNCMPLKYVMSKNMPISGLPLY